VIIKEEDQSLLRVIAVVMIIGKDVVITEVMDIIIIRGKERVEVSLAVKKKRVPRSNGIGEGGTLSKIYN
jgi:hypothetical protein